MPAKLKNYTVSAKNRVTGSRIVIDVVARSKNEARQAAEKRHLWMLSDVTVKGPF